MTKTMEAQIDFSGKTSQLSISDDDERRMLVYIRKCLINSIGNIEDYLGMEKSFPHNLPRESKEDGSPDIE